MTEEGYLKKRDALEKECAMRRKNKQCIDNPSPERCGACNVGKRMRWLESEASQITGWSHTYWKN